MGSKAVRVPSLTGNTVTLAKFHPSLLVSCNWAEVEKLMLQKWAGGFDRRRVRAKKVADLCNELTVLGQGRSRIVFAIGDSLALKVATSEEGITGCSNEAAIYKAVDSTVKRYLLPVLASGHGWILTPRVDTLEYDKETCEYEDWDGRFHWDKLEKIGNKLFLAGVEADDLHEGNVGWIGGRMVVVDYGMFFHAASVRRDWQQVCKGDLNLTQRFNLGCGCSVYGHRHTKHHECSKCGQCTACCCCHEELEEAV